MAFMSISTLYSAFSQSVEETQNHARLLASCVKPGDVIMLTGSLGAGKTHFVQGLALGLGVTEPVLSPTFNLLLVYNSGRIPLYHFDLYRLDTEDQLDDLDFYGTLEGDGVSCIEWAEKFPAAMPDDALAINIIGDAGASVPEKSNLYSVDQEKLRKASQDQSDYADQGRRVMEIYAAGVRSSELLDAWVTVDQGVRALGACE